MKGFIIFLLLFVSHILCAQNRFNNLFEEGEKYRAMGLSGEALKWYEKAERVVSVNKKSDQLKIWRRMAESYKAVADYRKSLSYYEKILEVFAGNGFPYRDETLLNMSGVLLRTGRYDKVVRLLQELKLEKGEKVRLVNLSNAYYRMGKTDDAIQVLNQAIEKHVSGKDVVYTTALQNKGYIYWSEKRYSEASEILKSVVGLWDDNEANRYGCIGNLAIIESELGDYENALNDIDKALLWQKQYLGVTHPDYAVSLRKKAEILLKMNLPKEATEVFKEYFEREKAYIISNFAYMTENERLDFWNVHKSLLAECYATEDIDPEFLFDVAVFSKSVLLQVNRNFLHLVSKDKKLFALYTKLKALRMGLSHAASEELEELERESELLERQLMAKMGTLKSFVNDLKTGSKEVRKAIKNDSDRVIEFIQYSRNDTIYYAALVMDKDLPVRFVPLFTQASIENHQLHGKYIYGTVKEAIYSRRDADKNRLYTDSLLGRKIWEPLLSAVPENANVYFTPDGLFHLLGIEYLCFDRPDCQLFRLSSSRQLCRSNQFRKDFSLLLVGGLDYNDNSAVIRYTDTLPDRRSSEILFYDKQPPAVGGGYAVLRGSSAEIDSIKTLFGNDSCRLIKEANGTEESIKREMQKYNIVHLSTHGFCSDYQVVPRLLYDKDSISEDLSLLRCGVILAGANLNAKQDTSNRYVEDGILTARELCDLDLSKVDLIVLSACQTGLGRITIDGIAGLPRGLKKAGANSVIVSLWEVDDKATQLLMSLFYKNLKEKKMAKHQALRCAQEDLKNWKEEVTKTTSSFSPSTLTTSTRTKVYKCNYNKPCYWAAFILIDGNDK